MEDIAKEMNQAFSSNFDKGFIADMVEAGNAALIASDNIQEYAKSLKELGGNNLDIFEHLQNYSENSPFDLKDVVNSAKNLELMGVQAKDLIPTLTELGEVAAGSHISLTELSKVYGNVLTHPALTRNDIAAFAHAGIPQKEMSNFVGKSPQAMLDHLAGPGGVDFHAVDNQMNEFGPSVRACVQALEDMAAAIGDIGKDAGLVTLLHDITKGIEFITKEIKSFAQAHPVLGEILVWAGLFSAAILAAGVVLVGLVIALGTLAGAIMSIAAVAADDLLPVLGAIALAGPLCAGIFAGIVAAVLELVWIVEIAYKSFVKLFHWVGSLWPDMKKGALAAIDLIEHGLKILLVPIEKLIGAWKSFHLLQGAKDIVTETVANAKQQVPDMVENTKTLWHHIMPDKQSYPQLAYASSAVQSPPVPVQYGDLSFHAGFARQQAEQRLEISRATFEGSLQIIAPPDTVGNIKTKTTSAHKFNVGLTMDHIRTTGYDHDEC